MRMELTLSIKTNPQSYVVIEHQPRDSFRLEPTRVVRPRKWVRIFKRPTRISPPFKPITQVQRIRLK